MLIEIPRQHWPSLANTAPPVIEQPAAAIPELIFRLTAQRPTPEALADMKAAAHNDNQRLQLCLDSFLKQCKGWTTIDLLTVAVQEEFRPRNYWDRMARA
jgi:hypothetical protein